MKKISLAILFFCATFICFSQDTRTIRECIIEKGVLKEVDVTYNINTGAKTLLYNGTMTDYETLGKSTQYAGTIPWYINSEEINYGGKSYSKYGLPRILGVNEIKKHGEFRGVGVYIEASLSESLEIIYVPVRQGCEFQPYVRQVKSCGTVTITPAISKIKKGKKITFTAHIPTATDKLTYTWTAHSGQIVGKSNTKSVVISTASATKEIDVEVYVKGQGCESTAYRIVMVN